MFSQVFHNLSFSELLASPKLLVESYKHRTFSIDEIKQIINIDSRDNKDNIYCGLCGDMLLYVINIINDPQLNELAMETLFQKQEVDYILEYCSLDILKLMLDNYELIHQYNHGFTKSQWAYNANYYDDTSINEKSGNLHKRNVIQFYLSLFKLAHRYKELSAHKNLPKIEEYIHRNIHHKLGYGDDRHAHSDIVEHQLNEYLIDVYSTYGTQQIIYKMLEASGQYEMLEDCVIAYKVVTRSLSSLYAQKMIYEVGKTYKQPSDFDLKKENTFGLWAWTEAAAKSAYSNVSSNKIIKLEIPYHAITYFAPHSGQIRANEFKVLSIVE